MLKNISTLGKVLNKTEQQILNGGGGWFNISCSSDSDCWEAFEDTATYCCNGKCGAF